MAEAFCAARPTRMLVCTALTCATMDELPLLPAEAVTSVSAAAMLDTVLSVALTAGALAIDASAYKAALAVLADSVDEALPPTLSTASTSEAEAAVLDDELRAATAVRRLVCEAAKFNGDRFDSAAATVLLFAKEGEESRLAAAEAAVCGAGGNAGDGWDGEGGCGGGRGDGNG